MTGIISVRIRNDPPYGDVSLTVRQRFAKPLVSAIRRCAGSSPAIFAIRQMNSSGLESCPENSERRKPWGSTPPSAARIRVAPGHCESVSPGLTCK